MLGRIALGFSLAAILLVAFTLRDGFLVVRVDESSPETHHIHLILPATFLSAGLALAPTDKLRQAAEKAGPLLPAVRESCHELERSPDFTLVDADDPTDRVTIQKTGRDLRISVLSKGDNVFVSVPLVTIEKATDKLQSFQQPL